MKKPLIIVAVVILVLILIVLTLPFLIDVNHFKPTLETDLSTALSRKVEIGSIELAIFSGGVTVNDISISDDPGFSQSPFLQAKQLAVGVALTPLIFSKKLEVSSFTVKDPSVSLLRSPSGTWNFSSLGGNGAKQQTKNSSDTATNFSVQKITITDGTITVGTIGPGAKTQTYQNVALEASDLSFAAQFPFSFTAKTPGDGNVKIEGKAGPVNPADNSLTPLNARIDVQHLDLASTGFVGPSSGLAGVLDFSGTVSSDGQQMSSKGTVKADSLKLLAAGSAARVPVNIDYDTAYDLKKETGTLQQGDVHVGKALAKLSGTYDTEGTSTAVQMKLSGQGMSVPDLEGVLPAVGVQLPSGASLQSGALNVDLTVAGPVDKLVITGPIALSNGKLAGFNLKSKLGALGSFAGLGGGSSSDTEIQTLSANMRVDPSGTHADNINLVVPSVGTVTGTGNVTSSGQLNCQMNAKLAASGNPIGALASGVSLLGGGSKSQGGGIPFKIEGTTSNPKFVPDFSGTLGNLTKGGAAGAGSAGSSAAGIIGGLFGKKKSQ